MSIKEEIEKDLISPILTALTEEKLTLKYLVKKLKRELNATETKFFQKDGEVITERDCIAWDVRQKARQDAHKLRGDYPAEKIDLGEKPILIISKPSNGHGSDGTETGT